MNSRERLGHESSSTNNDIQCVSELGKITDISSKDIQSNEQNKDCSRNNLPQKDVSEKWNVIRKAVNSVKDEELRAQALKALAECCIGVERHVPKCPPEELKSVHDTQVQTTVFGLLDPSFFILLNKDIEEIQRLKQVTHEIFYMPNLPMQNNLVFDNVKQPNGCKTSDTIEEGDFDIDSYISKICEENLGALQVRETLSTTNARYQKIIEQLQQDFELAKKYDKDGMLSIHNAVIKNNIYDVQRYLMILKQCKESVDILTEDGETSLELAIKYDVRGDIVKLLLQSGAQPVILQSLRESALIIAAKRSSALLAMLVNHVSSPKLLDQVDSEGFAALHYCCKYCDVEGVSALILAGANVNLKDMKSGRTPLFHALESDNTSNRPKVVQKLIQAGAITSVTNFAGHMPLPMTNDGKNIPFMMSLRKDTRQIPSPTRYLL
ncbi:B-cell lymphoma 3-encoded protein-like protein [Harpegnathos saltator]|uniref:B-cell lymphoma 3-encoded protein-like protein n=2 Tax=Harpegnathos saltator TaxID=610380 RepID=E2BGA4_HARSA|nr:B-cell lymphoma 3-encoded protein-like protein [Harpegnathos saltator]